MKMIVMGVRRMRGKSAKTGNEFDFANVRVLVPVDAGVRGSVTVEGFGFEQGEIDLDVHALQAFKGLKFPMEVDLATDQVFRMGEIRTLVTGVQPVAKVG